jgi:argininosuccinate lyase
MKRALRTKSVGTKVSEAELRVLESRAERAGLTLSEWVRDVLLASSVDASAMAAERAILAEVLGMRAILLNFMLKLSMRQPITEQVSRELIAWADGSKMKRALEVLAKTSN